MNGRLRKAVIAKYGKCRDCNQIYNRRDNTDLDGQTGKAMKEFLERKIQTEGLRLKSGLCPYHEAYHRYRSFD